MKCLNEAMLIGNLGIDPELKETPQGTKVAVFTMATNDKWKDKATGQDKESVEWHRVVVWKGLAEIAAKYLKKGDPVYVQGKITNRTYEVDGVKKYITEIVARNLILLGGKGSDVPRPGDALEITDEDIPY